MANVLVVDDNNLTLMLIEVMLRRLNQQIIYAYNGQEALEILREQDIDLLISDINMPVMDGLTLLENVRADQEYQDLPVILMTAHSKENYPLIASQKGATDFLYQPFSSRDLTRAVGKCLGILNNFRLETNNKIG